ncbi:MAG: aldehyde ferredoxin oxidoreductase family protein [bacterium]|nr:aldehyde ferredoxin oxidoreductase family protein [bacterium]
MKLKGGYFFRILEVDLTSGTSTVRPFDEEFALKFIGGRGFGARILADHLKKHGKVDPLGPENILVIAPGPLTGVYLPSSGKNSFITLSPATGIYGDSSIGGVFGVELRQAGFDAVVLKGRAPVLSFLSIEDDKIKVVPMPRAAGATNLEAEKMVREATGDEDMKIASIGPAGENAVVYSCVNTDWSRNAGRIGIGAVMGSKNLKAIAVRGSRDLPVANLPALMEASREGYALLKNHEYFRFWQEQGLMSVVDYANKMGILPTRNFQETIYDRADRMNGYVMEDRYKIGDSACFGCSMTCGNVCLVKEGKYRGTVTEGPEYESAAMLGSNLGTSNFAFILKANALCDELGVDTISTGSIIAAVIEGLERGFLTEDDLDGKAIGWGDEDPILELIEKISRREGVGDTLAGGARSIISRWPDMARVVNHVKGLEQSAYDARAAISMALGFGTSDIGAHHTRAWTVATELENGTGWGLEEKADFVIYHQTVRPLFDMLGVCRLPWIELGFPEEYYQRFFAAVTGVDLSMDELMARSNHIYDLTRAINVAQGVTRSDDYPPRRTLEDPVPAGPTAGKSVDREEYEKILSMYYEKRGWDQDGKPSMEL